MDDSLTNPYSLQVYCMSILKVKCYLFALFVCFLENVFGVNETKAQ